MISRTSTWRASTPRWPSTMPTGALIDADIEDDDRLGQELAARYPHGLTRETDDGFLEEVLARYPNRWIQQTARN